MAKKEHKDPGRKYIRQPGPSMLIRTAFFDETAFTSGAFSRYCYQRVYISSISSKNSCLFQRFGMVFCHKFVSFLQSGFSRKASIYLANFEIA